MIKNSRRYAWHIALGLLLLSLIPIQEGFADEIPCTKPDKLARTGGATWPQGVTVTVVINPSDFPTQDQQQAVQQAFIIWQNTHTDSGVTFTFTTGSNPAGALNTYYVHRGPTDTGGGHQCLTQVRQLQRVIGRPLHQPYLI